MSGSPGPPSTKRLSRNPRSRVIGERRFIDPR
jgi:hypothetical protein